ncbi:hypothetical protein C0V75_10195 [Tabrizicola sp. TH137]|nr:hypothetical protein C0V75_10195 [Tabrizicola sp. TH137]
MELPSVALGRGPDGEAVSGDRRPARRVVAREAAPTCLKRQELQGFATARSGPWEAFRWARAMSAPL